MHPTEIMELSFVGALFVVIAIISLFFKGKSRRNGLLLALAILVGYGLFYIAQPYWIDWQIEKKVALIEPYLEYRFPGEKFTISTVDHRDFKQKQKSPYLISVTFESEPDVIYDYRVESKDDIVQFSASATNKLKEKWDFKHLHLGKP